mmetsp:Transcript_4626/g.8025  ORF Transcript_4626/g.8025 Transcript_4626/m.8025 type:complete len:250 (+) Transcript_4626:93-842(+)
MSHRDELPCITYKKSFDQTVKFREVKLTRDFDNGTRKSRYIPVFTGEYGIEALLMVVTSFTKAASVLVFENAELFDNFDQCVSGVAETMWANIANNITAAERTTARFDSAVTELYTAIIGANARDALIAYLERGVLKPLEVMPNEHIARMQEMVRIANILPGTEPMITAQQEKNIIFASFPRSWRSDYRRAKGDLATDSLGEITHYMTILKGLETTTKQTNKKRKHEDEGSDESRNRGRGREQRRGKRG